MLSSDAASTSAHTTHKERSTL